ncbi:MAG: autotransporter-associated beta strand repeat-containing protein, partial [Gallionella sp.]
MENVKGSNKSVLGRNFIAIALLVLSGTALLMPLAQAEPTGGQISAGAGAIAQAGATTTITQNTQNLAINWQSFSIGSNEAVRFNQPNASSIALNRVLGQDPSAILGNMTSNGQVFVLNPNGVLFGAGAQVNVGGLVATTLSLSDADFIAGNYGFSNGGTAGSVVNQGALTAAQAGYIALLAPEVRNEGIITATLGTALLAAGDKVTLNLNNGSLLSYTTDQGSLNALAENKQLIQADGGQVYMSAKAAVALSTAVVNNTGIIEARTIGNVNGTIILLGDMQVGQVNVGGTLDASAPNGGDGGFIETSAAHVNVASDAKITTEAVQGATGNWLIDPPDFTIAASAGDITGAVLSANLATTSVTILSSQGTVNLLGNGDIFVNDVVSWNSANSLTLNAVRNINVNSAIANAGTGAINLIAAAAVAVNANLSTAGAISITAPTGLNQAVATTITTGTGLTVDAAAASTSSGVIAGLGGLTKNGIGILTLSGINTYTGATTINAGGLTLSGAGTAASSAFTVNLGGMLTLNNAATNNTNRISNTLALTLNGGELVFNGTNVAATAASETIGALTLASGASTVTLNSGTGGGTTLTAASIARSAGATVLFRGTNLGAGAAAAGNTNLIFTTATGLGLVGANTGPTLKPIVPYAIGDTSATGAGIGFVTYNINLANNLANTFGIRPLAVATEYATTQAPGVNLRVTASVSPNATVTLNSLSLAGGFTYTIGSNGVVRTLTITSGAVFSAAGVANTITSGAGRTTDSLAFGAVEAKIFAVGGLTFSVAPATGTAGLTKSGAGVLTFLTANAGSYTGATTINAGTLTEGVSNALSSGAVTVNGGIFNIGGVSDTVGAVTLTNGSITGTTGVLTSTGYTVSNGTVSAILAGAVPLTKTTAGTVTLSGVNTYTGVTTINAGILSVATIGNGLVAGNLGAASNVATNLILGGGTLRYTGATAATNRAYTLTAGTTSSIDVSVGANTLTMSGVGALTTGALTKVGAGTLALTGVNLYTGATTINAGSLSVNGTAIADLSAVTMSSVATLALTGNEIIGSLAGGGNVTLGAFTITAGGDNTSTTYSGVISGTGGVTKAGTGTWALSGANTYTGATTILAGSLLTGTLLTDTPLAVTVSTGASVYLGANTSIGSLAGGGNVSLGAYTMTAGGDNISTIFSGVISGTGGLIKVGTGTWTLSGANTYSGATTISAGTLSLGNASALGTSAGINVSTGATLDLNGITLATARPLTLNGTGVGGTAGALTNSSLTAATYSGAITLGSDSSIVVGIGSTLSSTGTINGAFTLNVLGGGAVTLGGAIGNSVALAALTGAAGTALNINGSAVSTSGAQTYSGTTTFGAATLLTAGNISATGAVTATVGILTLATGAGNVTLANPGNNFGTVAVSSGANVSLIDSNAILIAGINVTGLVDVRTQTGDLTLTTAAIATTSTSADAVTLIADINSTLNPTGSGGNFINAGNVAITTGAGGAWRIYTGNPTGTVRGGLVEAAKRYNVDDGSDPLVSGNRIYFRIQPTLTITTVSTSKVYNSTGADPALTYTLGGLIDGDTTISILPTISRVAGSNVGTYAISATGAVTTVSYTIAYMNTGLLTITQAPLAVAANAASKVYDGLAYSGGNGVTYTGLVNGETSAVLGGVLAYGGTSQGAINAGSYVITPSGLTSTNYAISYFGGALSITPATLTYTATPASRGYGATDPVLSGNVTGFVNAETLATATTGTLTFTT